MTSMITRLAYTVVITLAAAFADDKTDRLDPAVAQKLLEQSRRAGSPPAVVERDARRDKSASGHYLVFCARESPNVGLPGHAFVVWGKDNEEKQLCSVEAYGFYPKQARGIDRPGRTP
jgi:hypothetical protein